MTKSTATHTVEKMATNAKTSKRKVKISTTTLIQSLIMNNNMPQEQATACVETIQKTIKEALVKGQDVSLKKIGVIKPTLMSERKAYIPRIEKKMMIPAHYILQVTTSQQLRSEMTKNLTAEGLDKEPAEAASKKKASE